MMSYGQQFYTYKVGLFCYYGQWVLVYKICELVYYPLLSSGFNVDSWICSSGRSAWCWLDMIYSILLITPLFLRHNFTCAVHVLYRFAFLPKAPFLDHQAPSSEKKDEIGMAAQQKQEMLKTLWCHSSTLIWVCEKRSGVCEILNASITLLRMAGQLLNYA